MNEEPYEGPDRRNLTDEMETLVEEAACRGARKVLGAFTDHDLGAKEGRGDFRADLRHLHRTRVGSEHLKQTVKTAAIRTGIGAVVLGACYAVWQAIAPHLKGDG